MARKLTPSEIEEQKRAKAAAELRRNLARANGRKRNHARDIGLSPEPRRKRVRASSSDVVAAKMTEVSSVTGDEEEEEEESVEDDGEGAVEGPVDIHARKEEDESVVTDMPDDTVRCINMFAECVRRRAETIRQQDVPKMSWTATASGMRPSCSIAR